MFYPVEEVKQRIGEALEDIKIDEFKSCSEQRKDCLNRGTASKGGYLKVTDV